MKKRLVLICGFASLLTITAHAFLDKAPDSCPRLHKSEMEKLLKEPGSTINEDGINWQLFPNYVWNPPRNYAQTRLIKKTTEEGYEWRIPELPSNYKTIKLQYYLEDKDKALTFLSDATYRKSPYLVAYSEELPSGEKREMGVEKKILGLSTRYVCSYRIFQSPKNLSPGSPTLDVSVITISTIPKL